MYLVNAPNAMIAKKDAVIPKISNISVKKRLIKSHNIDFNLKNLNYIPHINFSKSHEFFVRAMC